MMRRQFLLGSLGGLTLAAADVRPSWADQAGSPTATGPVVRTQAGNLRGSSEAGVHVFRGIPFAEPPFGPHRMQPPQPRAPWDGVRDALAFGPKSPQQAYPPEVTGLVPPEVVEPGEDCLTLNIWSKELGGTAMPVMVWISGGLFEFHGTGASPWYDGGAFARDGVVCVTLTYRVGADGFLFLNDGIANLGLLDQIAALQWVQDNIASFGGDPGNVTIFGESAGASSVALLCASPRARGLFRRAIVQSGGAQHLSPAPVAEWIGRRFAETLGVPATRAAIAAVPPDRTIVGQAALRAELMANPDPHLGEIALTSLFWQPAIDGDVIPASPLELLRSGAAGDVDLMVGTNLEETRLMLVQGIDQITDEAVAATIAGFGLPVAATLAAYRDWHPNASAGDLMAALMTDFGWRLPALGLADAHASGARAGRSHMYEFAWRSPQFGGRLGAAHSVEIPFVFDTLGQSTEHILGAAPPQVLADTMHKAWVAFATTGDPGWAEYDLDRRATRHFDEASTVIDDPLAKERALWAGVR